MDTPTGRACVTGVFDDLRSADIRFLEEAARFGHVHAYVWSDDLIRNLYGTGPRFPLKERHYFLSAIRYVDQVRVIHHLDNPQTLPFIDQSADSTWVVKDAEDDQEKKKFCSLNGMKYQVVEASLLNDFPDGQPISVIHGEARKKVLVTGCYDWLHSGHVRFFEEASGFGDLYVVVGSDENVRLLKGKGHPMFPQEERRYVVQSIRYVKQALISSGIGWMDAEPEIKTIQPNVYILNEDGDQPEKRDFCQTHLIQYLVLKRTPKEGLPTRQSTDLRGF
jgi:cytidyltransferase-like protein